MTIMKKNKMTTKLRTIYREISTMAKTQSPQQHSNTDSNNNKSTQNQPMDQQKASTKKNERSDRRTRSSSAQERYLAPYEGLTVWNKSWTFKDTLDVNKTKLNPFPHLFGETDSIHEAILIRNKSNVENKTGYVHTVAFWKYFFLEGFGKKNIFHIDQETKKKAKQVAIRLSLTAPSIFDESEWIDGNLRASEHSAAWSAAQHILGTWRWNSGEIFNNNEAQTNNINNDKQEEPNDDNDPATTTGDNGTVTHAKQRSEKGKQSVNFDENTIDPKHRNPLFIQKLHINPKQPTQALSKDFDRKNKIFIKWKSPKLLKESVEEMETEIVEHFDNFCKHLRELDESLIIIPWRGPSTTPPATKDTEIKDRQLMEKYVDKVFFRSNFATWCRLQIAFNIDPADLIHDEWYQGNAMYVGMETIQEKTSHALHGY